MIQMNRGIFLELQCPSDEHVMRADMGLTFIVNGMHACDAHMMIMIMTMMLLSLHSSSIRSVGSLMMM